MREQPLPPGDNEGVNPEGLGPAQVRPPAQDDKRQKSVDGDAPMPPPEDRSEMADNLKRERSKGSAG
jgi:hypothetical protein